MCWGCEGRPTGKALSAGTSSYNSCLLDTVHFGPVHTPRRAREPAGGPPVKTFEEGQMNWDSDQRQWKLFLQWLTKKEIFHRQHRQQLSHLPPSIPLLSFLLHKQLLNVKSSQSVQYGGQSSIRKIRRSRRLCNADKFLRTRRNRRIRELLQVQLAPNSVIWL